MNRVRIVTRELMTPIALVAAGLHAAPGVTLHVAVAGDDGNPGTVARPLASLAGARDKVRAVQAEWPATSTSRLAPTTGDQKR